MLGDLLKLATTALAYRAEQGRRLPAAMVYFLVAAGLAAVAIGCAIAAGWIYLVPFAGPAGAPLIAAGALLILCLILLAIGWKTRRARSQAVLPIIPVEAAMGEVKYLIQEHKGMVLLAAALAGLIFGTGKRY